MSRTCKGKQLWRLSRQATTHGACPNAAAVKKPCARQYHPANGPVNVSSTASTASQTFLFDASYPSAASGSKPSSAAGPQAGAPAQHALSPYNDLLSSAPFAAYYHDGLVAGVSLQPASLASNNANPFLPFYHAPPSTQTASSGPSDLLGASPRRADNKAASLCFRNNGAAGIPKRATVEGRLGKRPAPPPASLPGFRPLMPERDLRALKSAQVGEDAYFCRTDSLGVADGVGGWSGKKGADPALFSRLLMHYCAVGLERYDDVDDPLFLDYYNVDPIEILAEASLQALEEARQKNFTGSSTALLAVLRRDVLRVANLGDCNCAIIRGTDYLFRSEEQQHSFNYPMQVGTQSRDSPKKDAQRFDVKVQKDDIVILSSDGLIDNLFEEDILEEVLRFSHPAYDPSNPADPARPLGKQATFSPQAVSEALCSRAKAVIEDPLAVNSPFQQRAMEEGMYYTGGKPDDITVLVAVIGEERDSDDRR